MHCSNCYGYSNIYNYSDYWSTIKSLQRAKAIAWLWGFAYTNAVVYTSQGDVAEMSIQATVDAYWKEDQTFKL